MKRFFRAFSVFSAAIVAAGLLTVAAPAAPAQAAELPDSIVDGGFIISDAEFFDANSMTEDAIQTFLDSKFTTCASGATCLKNFKQTHPNKPADKYCSEITGGTNESAARIIHKMATACGINPKVLLVMLQKEQSLITHTNPSASRYDRAMGYACPDSGPNNTANCDSKYYGFANQVYSAARQMQVYTQNPTSFNYRPGRTNTIKWHPSNDCGTSRVYIENQATANLYIYTPYRANVAALAAGTATGDSCSSYGNRNFYNYYVSWFAPEVSSGSGAPAQVANCAQPLAADIAANSVTATVVGTDFLNVRRGPSFLCTNNMGSLAKGATVKITGQYGQWSRATIGGNTVWLATEFLSFPGGIKPSAHVGSCLAASGDDIKLAGGDFTVNIASLNVRLAPNTSCSFGVTTLASGKKVTRLGTYGIWSVVKTGSNVRWVQSEFLTAVPSATTTTTSKTVTTAAVNLRASNSTSSKILTVVKKGVTVTVLEKKGSWTKAKVGSLTGWLHNDYLKTTTTTTTAPPPTEPPTTDPPPTDPPTTDPPPTDPPTTTPPPATTTTTTTTTTGAVNLRSSNSTSSKILAVVKKGVKVTAIEKKGSWTKAKVGSLTGWLHNDYLKTTTTTKTTSTTSAKSLTVTAAVNFRAGANTSSKVISVLSKGTKVTQVSKSGVWVQVKHGSKTGWVHSSYVK